MTRALLAAFLLSLLAPPAHAQAPGGWDGAFWIWDAPEANRIAQNNAPRYLRRAFDLGSKPKQAELKISVDNLYEVWVNGQLVGKHNEWQAAKKYDVAKHLVQGGNVLAIKATNQGGVAGAIARLRITGADGKITTIGTDAPQR